MTDREYMVLSRVAYFNFSDEEINRKVSLDAINYDSKFSNDEEGQKAKALWDANFVPMMESMEDTWSNWQLIAHENQNDQSGFCGAAFKNPATGEIVFAFRGTEPGLADHMAIPEDFLSDAQLALSGQAVGETNQFQAAYDFVKSVMADKHNVENVAGYGLRVASGF